MGNIYEDAEAGEHSTANLLLAISRVQARLIADPSHQEIFRTVLEEMLVLTHSRYGFIGELKMQAEESPVLQIRAAADGVGQDGCSWSRIIPSIKRSRRRCSKKWGIASM